MIIDTYVNVIIMEKQKGNCNSAQVSSAVNLAQLPQKTREGSLRTWSLLKILFDIKDRRPHSRTVVRT